MRLHNIFNQYLICPQGCSQWRHTHHYGLLLAFTQKSCMHQQLQAEQHYGHPVLLCCGSYGNLKEHQMFYLKCEGIICDIVPPCIYGARNGPNPHDFSNWLNYFVLKSLFTLQIHPYTAAFVLACFLEWCLFLMVTGGLEPIPVDIGWGQGCARRLENPERAHADMGRTSKLHPQSPQQLNPQLPQLEPCLWQIILWEQNLL